MQLYPRPGVYELRHTPSGKCYVGYSTSVRSRIRKHFRRLRLGKHCNRLLQSLYSSSPDDWVAVVLEYEPENSAEAEARWIAKRGDSALNIIRVPWSGTNIDAEHRAQLALARTERHAAMSNEQKEEFRRKISDSWIARRAAAGMPQKPRKDRTDEYRSRTREARRRRVRRTTLSECAEDDATRS